MEFYFRYLFDLLSASNISQSGGSTFSHQFSPETTEQLQAAFTKFSSDNRFIAACPFIIQFKKFASVMHIDQNNVI